MLKRAAEALQRYVPAVLLYLGVAGVTSVVVSLVQAAIRAYVPDLDTRAPTEVHAINAGLIVALSIVAAVVQAVVFSRIGRDLDRPLWKVRDDREALQRFSAMWFELNLIVNATFWLSSVNARIESMKGLAILLELLGLAMLLFLVPIGACMMFHGTFSWGRLGEGLAPLGRRIGQAMPVFLATFVQVLLYVILSADLPDDHEAVHIALSITARALRDIGIAYIDCVVFVAVWLVCKEDRDSPDEIDLDF